MLRQYSDEWGWPRGISPKPPNSHLVLDSIQRPGVAGPNKALLGQQWSREKMATPNHLTDPSPSEHCAASSQPSSCLPQPADKGKLPSLSAPLCTTSKTAETPNGFRTNCPGSFSCLLANHIGLCGNNPVWSWWLSLLFGAPKGKAVGKKPEQAERMLIPWCLSVLPFRCLGPRRPVCRSTMAPPSLGVQGTRCLN